MPMQANSFPSAADALGLGDQLGQQVAGETEEVRRKRMVELQQKQLLGPAGSLAVTSLFGSNGGMPRGNY
jgi:hypothetical protein